MGIGRGIRSASKPVGRWPLASLTVSVLGLAGICFIFWRTHPHPVLISVVLTSYTILCLIPVFSGQASLRRAGKALDQSERKYRTLAENSSDIIVRVDRDCRYIYANPAAAAALGRAMDDFPGRTNAELGFSARLSSLWDRNVRAVVETRSPRQVPIRIGTGPKALVFDCRLIPEFSADGSVETVMCTARDVTRLKQAEELARRNEERYRMLFTTMRDAFALFQVVRGADGGPVDLRFVEVNAALEALSGLHQEEVLGRTLNEAVPGADPFWVETFAKVAETGRSVRFERHAARLDKDLDVAAYRPRPGQCAVVCRDVSERKRLQARLQQAEKMQAIGQLAGGIAHDFNNLLTAILGEANLLMLQAEPMSPFHEAAATISKAAERAAELTRQLLGFARKGKHQVVNVNVGQAIRETVSLLSRTFDKKIDVSVEILAASACVQGDPGQIQQVLMNLAVNARDSMPDGGRVIFRAEVVDLDARECGAHAAARPGRYVQISVIDTGCGIPEEMRDRIFEPFFTTKEPGCGTGMGLPMVYGIVQNHDGFIGVESQVGKGTTFRVILPLAPAAAPKPGSDTAPVLQRGSGCILLVDDEEVVRRAGKAMLESLGYRVIPASGPQEAAELFAGARSEVGLAIIDMVMPGMDGRECFLALRAIDPSLKAILSTGYGLEGKAQAALDEGMAGFLQKPYRLEALDAAVAAALAAPGPRKAAAPPKVV